MKFLHLEIRNINSIESAELDFENSLLKNEPIFLIHGETGSGKSTILDAICLALYKTTPRLAGVQRIPLNDEAYRKNIRGGESRPVELSTQDPRQYMRRGMKQGDSSYVQLIFEGNDGNVYKARIEFGIGRQMSLADIQWRLEMPNGEMLARDNDIKPVIQEQVGLDFQQFCRTTLLAQGEFTKFLKADVKDKAAILEKITQTDIYSEIGKRISERTSHEKSELESLCQQDEILSQGLMSEEQLAEAQGKKAELEAQNYTLAGLESMWAEQMQWLNDMNGTKTQREAKLAEHNRQKQRMDNPEFQKYAELVNQWREHEKERHAYSEAENISKQITENIQSLERLKITTGQLLSATKYLMQEADNNIKSINENSQKETEQKRQYETLNKQINEIDINSITSLQTSLSERKNNAQELMQRIADLKLKREEEAKVIAKLQQDNSEKKTLEDAREALQAKMKQTEDAIKTAQDELDKVSLAVGTYAKQLRLKLQKGDACPVCGQKVDIIPHDEAFENAVRPYSDKINELKKQDEEEKKQYNKFIADIKGYDTSIGLCNTNLTNLRKRIQELEATQAKLCGLLGISSVEGIEDLLMNTNNRLKEIEPQIMRHNQLVGEREKVNSELNAIRQTLTQMRERAMRLSDILDTANNSSANLPNDWKTQQPEPCGIREDELKQKWTKLAQDYNAYINNATQLNMMLQEQEKVLTDSELGIDKIKELAKFSPDYITRIENEQKNIKKDIDRSEGELDSLNKIIAELEQKRPAISDSDTAQNISGRLNVIRNTINDNNRILGTIIQQIKSHHNTEKNVAEIRGKVQEQRKVYEQWKELADIFGGLDNPKFRAIAQSFVMRELLHHANKYMEAFMPRYQLECQGDNLVVQVRDRYCNGQLRNFATASGGESFVVSLALALGLMSLGEQAIKVDTLFIDEGFGSLDSETLETVVESLGKLHDICNRRVGIISHVESLKERIATRITLQKGKDSNLVTGLRIE